MGLLSGASNALEKGNVRRVAEIFSELPEKIAVDSGVFTKDQVIRGFLLENANVIRNKHIAPVTSEKLMEFVDKLGSFGQLSAGGVRLLLAKIGLNGFNDGKISSTYIKDENKTCSPTSKAIVAGAIGGVIAGLAVGGGLFAAGASLPILALIGIAVAAAVLTGLIAGGITYVISSKIESPDTSSLATEQGLPQLN